jgi:hypothetical protein
LLEQRLASLLRQLALQVRQLVFFLRQLALQVQQLVSLLRQLVLLPFSLLLVLLLLLPLVLVFWMQLSTWGSYFWHQPSRLWWQWK